MSEVTTTHELGVASLLDRSQVWAVLPETMALISAVARGELTVEAAAARGRPRAAMREERPRGESVTAISLRGLVTPRGTVLDQLCGTGGGLEAFSQSLAEAAADSDVAAIVLDIDSPGGLSSMVAETAAEIRAARTRKPVVAVANTLAASAAYWLAAQADEVVVTPSGYVGSVGVYATHVDISGAEQIQGIRTTLVSAGRYKTEANPYAPLSDEARAGIQEMVDEAYGQFIAGVAVGRGVDEATVRGSYGEGRVLSAERAVRAGVADRVATLSETMARFLGTERRPSRPTAGTRSASTSSAADSQRPQAADGGPVPEDPERRRGMSPEEGRLAAAVLFG